MAKNIYWIGTPITCCEYCKNPIPQNIGVSFYDAKTKLGHWCILCGACFEIYGIGLGRGLGQRFQRQKDGLWLKVGG